MNKLLFALPILFVSCVNNRQVNNVSTVDTPKEEIPVLLSCQQPKNLSDSSIPKIIDEETDNELISETEQILHHCCQGIWGDYSYLDTLKKYNSVVTARHIFGEKLIEIQIDKNNIWTDTPFQMEAFPLHVYQNGYKILYEDNEIHLLDVESNSMQIFKRIPYDKELDASLSLFKIALAKMDFLWFHGKYDMFDGNDQKINRIEFDLHGNVKGYERTRYCFGYDIEDKNWILFTDMDEYHNREYLLMDLVDNRYIFYSLKKDFDSFDDPLIKGELKFYLGKIEE